LGKVQFRAPVRWLLPTLTALRRNWETLILRLTTRT
jgi:hypothetical protein